MQEIVPGQSSCWSLLVLENPKKPSLYSLPLVAPLYSKSSVCLVTPLQTGIFSPLSLPETPCFLHELGGQVTEKGTWRG